MVAFPPASKPELIKLGLLGFPLGHSLSPVIHQAFLQACQLPGYYQLIETPAEQLPFMVERLKKEGYSGWNITIPHKVAMLKLVDSLSPEAEMLGAINTVVFNSHTGQTIGYNTDGEGFWLSLPSKVQQKALNEPVVLLGTGGSCRAVLGTLLGKGCQDITLVARHVEKAFALVEQFSALYESFSLQAQSFTDATGLALQLSSASLLINTTPVGMWPQAEASPLRLEQIALLPKAAHVMDLIYKPKQTLLLKKAERCGLSWQNGLGMLIYQAALAFHIWTGNAVHAQTNVISSVFDRLALTETITN